MTFAGIRNAGAGQGEIGGWPAAEIYPEKSTRAANLYPTPRTVLISLGALGSFSIFFLSFATRTSTLRLSGDQSRPASSFEISPRLKGRSAWVTRDARS